ncbi:hypothetical protein [Prosthecobacter sp.]|uniref:hypothetical protein n=1 Tax=Prosthecobacter sp. TaxID=1965333 RepID=UPI0037832ADE
MNAIAADEPGQRHNALGKLYPEGFAKLPVESRKKALNYLESWTGTFSKLGVSGLKDGDKLRQTYEKELLPLLLPLEKGTPLEKNAFKAGTQIYDALRHLGTLLASPEAAVDLELEKLVRFQPGTESDFSRLTANVFELFQDYFQLVAPDQFEQKIQKTQQSDLMVFTQKLKTYKVEKLPATQALEQIWIQATGKPPQMISPDWYSPKKDPEPLISLDLEDVPTMEIIRYISELASSRVHIRGYHGDGLRLQLEQLIESDHTAGMAYFSMASISAEGARRLGLKPGMTSPDILKRLRYFGMNFDDTRHPAAVYNAKEGKIAAILPPGRQGGYYLGTLAALADRGQIVPYKP